MTLLVALANERFALLLADRRITNEGRLLDDEFNKVCILFCDDARVAVGFTGLATYEDFDMSDWLLDTLADIGHTTGGIADILAELKVRATDKLRAAPVADKRLSFLFTGFVYWEHIPRATAYVLSNYANGQADNFSLRSIPSDGGSIIEIAGALNCLSPKIDAQLRRLLTSKLPPSSVLRFAVKQLQDAATNGRAGGLIGTQSNSAIILATPNTTVTTTYHSAFHSYAAYGANVVITKGMRMRGTEVFSSTIMAGAEIRKQDPCWCGSGQKFKHCHLKKFGSFYIYHSAFKKPMYMVGGIDYDESRLSGRTFWVASGYE